MYLENRILKQLITSLKRNIKTSEAMFPEKEIWKPRKKQTNQEEPTKPEMQRYASELPPYPREREMVKLIRAQGGCLGTKSR